MMSKEEDKNEEWKNEEWVNDPEIQDFLDRVDKQGPWDSEDDRIHTVGGLTNDKEGSFMKFQNKMNKTKFPIPKYDPYTGDKNPYYEELTKDDWLINQYNRNRPSEDHITEVKEIDSERAVEIINESEWKETVCNNVMKFQFGSFPEIIYVIKTGFKNKYIVVNEDAYELHLGETKLMTKDKVEKTYNIKLSI